MTGAEERFEAATRAEWRRWLEQHHATAPRIWLAFYKQKSGRPTVSYDEAVEEALCFGWIDSRANALDGERYVQLFTPRKPKSPWSALNKQRIERLLERGLMTPAGLSAIETAKANGSWTVYDGIENLEVPPDLEAALATNATAHEGFDAFSPSTRKQLLWWIQSAKRETTRRQRIEEIVRAAEQNRNPLAYPRRRDA